MEDKVFECLIGTIWCSGRAIKNVYFEKANEIGIKLKGRFKARRT